MPRSLGGGGPSFRILTTNRFRPFGRKRSKESSRHPFGNNRNLSTTDHRAAAPGDQTLLLLMTLTFSSAFRVILWSCLPLFLLIPFVVQGLLARHEPRGHSRRNGPRIKDATYIYTFLFNIILRDSFFKTSFKIFLCYGAVGVIVCINNSRKSLWPVVLYSFERNDHRSLAALSSRRISFQEKLLYLYSRL